MSRAAGYTLVEVLVALVVISIGLLGLAGLQVTALKQNQSAYMRSQATLLAYDLLERVRANPSGLTPGGYFSDRNDWKANTNCTTTSGCNPTEMARHDLSGWLTQLQQELPGGEGLLCRDADTSDGAAEAPTCGSSADSGLPLVVYVWWDDYARVEAERRQAGGDRLRLAVSTNL